jgi:hypothetical protein
MELEAIQHLIDKIDGCTFATLDAVTKPSAGVKKVTTGERVMLFTNKHGSGYEKMVHRRLRECGLNPKTFTVEDLLWGSRVPNTPLIEHHGKYYLQVVVLQQGETDTFIGNRLVPKEGTPWLLRDRSNEGANQGLPRDKRVIVRAYALKSITSITLMKETVTA